MNHRQRDDRRLRSHILGHGGNLGSARALYPNAPEPWIDLSTGINPHPFPIPEISRGAWTRLPEADAVLALREAATRSFGAADPAGVVAAPGTQALIQWLPRVRPARTVAVIGPTYAEHAAAWSAAGAEVREVATIEEAGDAEVIVVVNPNNPDGRILRPETLVELATGMGAAGRLLVVDEAFVDVVDGVSLVPLGVPDGAVVLRSFGKTWGLAGVRLGFAATTPALAAALETALGPWAVPGPTIEIATRALADSSWLSATRERLLADQHRLDRLLEAVGLTVVGGTPLFRLVRSPEAPAWFDRLARGGILVRPFAYAPDWLRFGMPGRESEWRRLEETLQKPA